MQDLKTYENDSNVDLNAIEKDAADVTAEILKLSGLKPGQLLVIGCSSSEVVGERVGTHSSMDVAGALYRGITSVTDKAGVIICAQCCEHLNRAIVMERAEAEKLGLDEVNVIPHPKAGGSFGTTVYKNCKDPVVVESLMQKADAGMDIGGVMVGMHIKPVVVPLKITKRNIGQAIIVAARRRPKYVGGARAAYNEALE
jgi:uncharacterized protein (TIGR01440 family)